MAAKLVSGDIATYSVKVNGGSIPDQFMVQSIYIKKTANRIPKARIVILDGDPATENFPVSSSATFVPGASITIEAGYDSNNSIIFQGIVTGQSLRVNVRQAATLEVECRDEAVKMTVGRKCLIFSNQKDSDIITSIIGTYSGLRANVTATATTWTEQVQYYATDWDFMLARAEANGMLAVVLNGKVAVMKPGDNTSSVATITYGDNLLAFSAGLDAIKQLASVTASSWDYRQQAVATGQANNNVPGPGNLSSKTLSEVIGLSSYQLQTSAPLDTADLDNWSQAQMVKSEYSKIQGTVTTMGSGLLEPGNYITLAGLGDRFSGDHFVSGVVHEIAQGNWTTEISIGLSNQWFTQEVNVMAPPASGLLPGARGLFNGTVKKMFEDPDSQYRILVNVPLFDQNGEGIWARLANFYSTSGAGAFFLPEVGDEVVIGFLNEDPRYPVILGSLYSNAANKPYKDLNPVENNPLKAIVSKTGISVEFDDENKILTVKTPGKNQVVLNDKAQQITIQDSNSNAIVMSASGIEIKSCSDIKLSATTNVVVSGPTGISVTSSGGDVSTSGLNIKENADIEFAAQGNANASVQGGAELTLKGAMVMIN